MSIIFDEAFHLSAFFQLINFFAICDAPRPTAAPQLKLVFSLRLTSAQFHLEFQPPLGLYPTSLSIMGSQSDDSMDEGSRVAEVCGDLFDAPEGSCLIRKSRSLPPCPWQYGNTSTHIVIRCV